MNSSEAPRTSHSAACTTLPATPAGRGSRPRRRPCRRSCPHFLPLGQHALSEDLVCPGLVSLAGFLQPRDNICVQAQRYCLLYGAIEAAPDSVLPSVWRKLRDIGCVDLVVG